MLCFKNGTYEQTYYDALNALVNKGYLIGGDPQISYETNSFFQFKLYGQCNQNSK